MTNTPSKNPYAAVWEQAEKSLTYRINAVHHTGVDIDRAHKSLAWRGGAADHFTATAHNRHADLHQHNDVLRNLLNLIQQAAATKPATTPAPATVKVQS